MLYIILTITTITVFAIVHVYNKRRKAFVIETSIALNAIDEINSRHSFIEIPCYDMVAQYDNKDYYDTIAPLDYLIYQLIYQQKTIVAAINHADENKKREIPYLMEVQSCELGKFSRKSLFKKITKLDQILQDFWIDYQYDKLCHIEKSLFDAKIKQPVTAIDINVCLHRTDIRGRRFASKSATFSTAQILKVINALQQKENGYYSDPNLWHAICRVERGKVSNKMRFAIYNRDGNRCRKCGSTRDLEIDHIYPISKGGKTTFDNLQTLCHSCNVKKGNFIESNSVTFRNMPTERTKICPNCNIPLARRRGSYGEFWGCPNYPRCRYTSK